MGGEGLLVSSLPAPDPARDGALLALRLLLHLPLLILETALLFLLLAPLLLGHSLLLLLATHHLLLLHLHLLLLLKLFLYSLVLK